MAAAQRLPQFMRWTIGIGGAVAWATTLTLILLWIIARYAVGWVIHIYTSAPYLGHVVLRVYTWEGLALGVLGGLLSFWLTWDRLSEIGVL